MIRSGLLLACLALALAGTAAAEVPEGFEDSPIASFDGAMSLAFTPDGRLLIAGRTGQLRVYQHGRALANRPSASRTGSAGTPSAGSSGIAVDPRFASNGYVYLYYTFDKHHTADHGACPSSTSKAPVNRVSRFTLGPNNLVRPESEKVLLDNIPSAGNHNSGDLGFGKDGYLYVSVGDGGCDYARDSGCLNENDAARDQNILLGEDPSHHSQRAACRRTTHSQGRQRALRAHGPDASRAEMPGDLGMGSAQPVPLRLRPGRRPHPVVHQRRRREPVGGDRPGRGRRGLRMERPRGPRARSAPWSPARPQRA